MDGKKGRDMRTKRRAGFETIDTVGDGSATSLPLGYRKLDWTGISAYSAGDKTGDLAGMGIIPNTGTGVGIIPSSFIVSSEEAFTFRRGFFSSAWRDDATVTVQGFRLDANGFAQIAAETSFTVDHAENKLMRFGKMFQDMDAIRIFATGGTIHAPDNKDFLKGNQLLVDDLRFVFDSEVVIA